MARFLRSDIGGPIRKAKGFWKERKRLWLSTGSRSLVWQRQRQPCVTVTVAGATDLLCWPCLLAVVGPRDLHNAAAFVPTGNTVLISRQAMVTLGHHKLPTQLPCTEDTAQILPPGDRHVGCHQYTHHHQSESRWVMLNMY